LVGEHIPENDAGHFINNEPPLWNFPARKSDKVLKTLPGRFYQAIFL
jgi:hypothetical protein